MLFEVRDFVGPRLDKKLLDEFSQMEALLGLYVALRPDLPFGRTRSWAASPDFLATVATEVMWRKPGLVVECGSGVSTVVIARCLQRNGYGRLISVDHDEKYARQTRLALERHGLSGLVDVRHAPLEQLGEHQGGSMWYSRRAFPEDTIDMLVIDGPPTLLDPLARWPAGPVLFSLISRSGVVLLDDAAREGERECVRRWLLEHPSWHAEFLNSEKGTALLSQIVTETAANAGGQ